MNGSILFSLRLHQITCDPTLGIIKSVVQEFNYFEARLEILLKSISQPPLSGIPLCPSLWTLFRPEVHRVTIKDS